MFRSLSLVSTATARKMVPQTSYRRWASTAFFSTRVAREGSTPQPPKDGRTPAEQMEDAQFEFFDDDWAFLDELMDEGVDFDNFAFIPEEDAQLLHHEGGHPPKQP